MLDKQTLDTLITGVTTAGHSIRKYIGAKLPDAVSKLTTFDYGIPADLAAEEILLDTIKKSKLDCRIVSEESEEMGNSNADFTVYIDPLDGSVNFSRGVPTFCIGLAVYYKYEPYLGVIYDPNLDELFVAEKGKGISINGKTLVLPAFSGNLLINFEWFGSDKYIPAAMKLHEAGIRVRTAGSGVLALCYGTIGRGDGTLLVDNKPWDIAPGLVFVHERGFIVRQLNGKSVDLSQYNTNLLAAPKEIFERVHSVIGNFT